MTFYLLLVSAIIPSAVLANQDQSFYAEITRLSVRSFDRKMTTLLDLLNAPTKNLFEIEEIDFAICNQIGEAVESTTEMK